MTNSRSLMAKSSSRSSEIIKMPVPRSRYSRSKACAAAAFETVHHADVDLSQVEIRKEGER